MAVLEMVRNSVGVTYSDGVMDSMVSIPCMAVIQDKSSKSYLFQTL